jgi:coenzyme A diphosphatase NUDT7
VLLLLYADRRGELRVVITMRSVALTSFSGHAALPGGKADSLDEEPVDTARREAFEEIGLPTDDARIPAPFRIEHLCQLPHSLARTELAVRPCVAFLHADNEDHQTVEEAMVPILNAKEVAALFSAPFHNFLQAEDEERVGDVPPGSRQDWYRGQSDDWHSTTWTVHYFHVPLDNQVVARPKEAQDETGDAREGLDSQRFLVWGMTARMLVDAARLAYGEEPEFEHNDAYGDEALIDSLYASGRLRGEKRSRSDSTDDRSDKAKI